MIYGGFVFYYFFLIKALPLSKIFGLVLFLSKAPLQKRIRDLKLSLGDDFTAREIAVLACAMEELWVDFNIDAMKEVKVIQVDA